MRDEGELFLIRCAIGIMSPGFLLGFFVDFAVGDEGMASLFTWLAIGAGHERVAHAR
jgi:hypothetical protein